ncbi:MAG: cryptochrome/photolyase family protein [Phycisphaerae bacterium]|nr:MAG: cryptochrome/photolyase family protein [Phycisphaerae bacterium]
MIRKFSVDRLAVRKPVTHLAVVFGDQLDLNASTLKSLDKDRDAILMMEVAGESAEVPSHKQRTTLFLSAMRHFAQDALKTGYRVHYIRLDDPNNTQSLDGEIERAIRQLKPERLICTEPGEWRIRNMIEQVAANLSCPLAINDDDHFLVTGEEFSAWMAERKQPVMEHFYRKQRRKLDILMDTDGKPTGGEWNYDKDNRNALKRAPGLRPPYTPRVDEITQEVIALVKRQLPDLPGKLDSFRWAVTRTQARRALKDFVEHRLPNFGAYQDAMWSGEPHIFHSLVSPALNLKLLNPRECVRAAVHAFESGHAPLNSVEGFVRQIIGWREFIRGIYWHEGPDYGRRNALEHQGALPEFYWTGETDMVCMGDALGQVIEQGYGHHIQRLMVTGNFALLAGIDPRLVSDWYLGMYVDAVDWVTSPNVLGMALHADGGVVGTKPYAASGKYIQRMSNYCTECRFDPGKRHGPDACPFTTFYWDFLLRHEDRFRNNHRMTMMLKNLSRLSKSEKQQITQEANKLRVEFAIVPPDGA